MILKTLKNIVELIIKNSKEILKNTYKLSYKTIKMLINSNFTHNFKKVIKIVIEKVPDLIDKLLNITKVLRNTKVKFRLMVSFLIISIIPLVLLGMFSFNLSRNSIDSKINMYTNQIIGQTQMTIETELEKQGNYLVDISVSLEVQDMLKTINNSKSQGDKFKALNDLRNVMTRKLSPIDAVKSAVIYIGDEIVEYSTNHFFKTYLKDEGDRIKELAQGGNGSTVWIPVKYGDSYQLLCTSTVNDINTSKRVGYIVVALKNSIISDIYKDINLGEGSDLFILDSQGRYVSNRNDVGLGEVYGDNELFEKMLSNVDSASGLFSHNGFMVLSRAIEGTDWTLIGKIPYSYINEEPDRIRFSVLFFIFGSILFSFLFSYIISMSISKPLSKMVSLINKAKDGNLALSIEDNNKDEIGDVIRSVNHMLGNMRKLIEQVNFSSQKVLKNSLLVNSSAEQSNTASKQISHIMEQVAVGAAEQAENITDCAQSLNVLSIGINKVEDNMDVVTELASGTKKLSQDAVNIVRTLNEKAVQTSTASEQVIGDIYDLSKSIEQISKIVKTISWIADQTNLLSLNASIEAAKAGEAGRGFSVVAEEVKKLADQSKDSSKEIAIILRSILHKTNNTRNVAHKANVIVSEQMQIVEETDNAFKEIYKSMEKLSECFTNVSDSITDAIKSKDSALDYIQNISAISQQTASISEEVSTATQQQASSSDELSSLSKGLEDMAKELNESISYFKLEE